MSSETKKVFEPIPKNEASIKKIVNSYKYRDQFFRPRSKQRIKVKSKTGIKHKTFQNKEKRKDAFGTPIQKGGKVHKVSFIDEIKKKDLAEISDIKETNRSFPEINKKDSNNTNINNNINISSINHKNKIIEQKVEIKCKACFIF